MRTIVLVVKKKYFEEALSLIRCLNHNNVVRVIKLSNWFYPRARTFLTKPLIEKVRSIIDTDNVSKVVIYDDLKPRHIVNLVKKFKVDVIDKITLILEIFALHAGSKEAKLQIEMAKITHTLPLIKELIRGAKMGELPGFLGPGAYAIDTYYKHLRRRLARIRRELSELRYRRYLERQRRSRLGYPQVAITGYTNAGKTTLFNVLTGESKPAGPEMFTTLMPKAKGITINGSRVILVDTVGFIRDIPAEVIEAFYATLEEIGAADLTVLVVDSSEHINAVRVELLTSLDILSKIGYVGKPLVVVLNKTDLIDAQYLDRVMDIVKNILTHNYRWRWLIVPISAKEGINIDLLKEVIYDSIVKTREKSVCAPARS